MAVHTAAVAIEFCNQVADAFSLPETHEVRKLASTSPKTAQKAMAYGLLLAAGEEDLAIIVGAELPQKVSEYVFGYCFG